jgi:hypothetical protein
MQPGGQFPSEIGHVLQPVIEAERAVGRMAVGGIAGDEHAARLVPVGNGHAQVPEPDMVEFAGEREAGDLLNQAMEIEIVLGGVGRNRGVEKPPLSHVDPAEELPIALQVRMITR